MTRSIYGDLLDAQGRPSDPDPYFGRGETEALISALEGGYASPEDFGLTSCDACGSVVTDADERAEVVTSWDWITDHAGGDYVLLDDLPSDVERVHHVVHVECYLANRDRYDLA